ncbi:3'(2'),5'-bisphosphate nucleotidase [Microvirga sp. 17 mud 1-3]|nr:3'(2'),5'-bisphosphate nucleotidase [Microvirga sp. 17 mud 1-3]
MEGRSTQSSGAGLSTTPAQQNALGLALGRIAVAAGKPVLDLFRTGTSVRTKSDASPVTEADLAAERMILEGLRNLLPRMPVISEEQPETHQLAPDEAFVLVDPLDGTREFIAKRDEFTINIAVIAKGRPIAGAIYAPALGTLWYSGAESFRLDVAPGTEIGQEIRAQPVKVRSPLPGGLFALVSRSHRDPATEDFLARLSLLDRQPMGSSLKFCRIAEGSADLYVRLGPTHEWDTAAGDAILSSAGGQVVDRSGVRLRYGKAELGFRHAGFIASGGLRMSRDKDSALSMP